MDGLLELLVPIVQLVSSGVLVVLFFIFIVRPLLNYIIVSREIEHRKKVSMSFPPKSVSRIQQSYESREDDDTLLEEESAETETRVVPDSQQQILNRLASSDADKAVDLVKQWANTDSSR